MGRYSKKLRFAGRTLLFCLIPFLFLEIYITGVKNSRHIIYKPPSPTPCISPTKNACDSAIRPKLCRNCGFPQNFQIKKIRWKYGIFRSVHVTFELPITRRLVQKKLHNNWSFTSKISIVNVITVEPRFFELPRDRQSTSKNRGFEKLTDSEKRSVLIKKTLYIHFLQLFLA